jgi:ABC-2 type transport system permease protein
MSDLIAAELLKLRTVRSFWWVSLLAVGLPVLITIITLATSTTGSEDDARSLLSNIGIAGVFMIILGVAGAAGEYRHGTITSTFLVAPVRWRALTAKAVAQGVGGLAVGVVCAALVLAISIPWLSSQGHPVSSLGLSDGDVAAIAAGSLAYVAISGLLGVGVGALVTSQVAAVVVVVILLFIVDPTVAALWHPYGRFSIGGLGQTLSGNSSENAGFNLFPIGVAALIYLGYTAALLAATAAVVTRRDVA